MVAAAVTPCLGSIEQALYFGWIKIVLRPFVGINGATLCISPFGRHGRSRRNPSGSGHQLSALLTKCIFRKEF
jgi:hypothetical protein